MRGSEPNIVVSLILWTNSALHKVYDGRPSAINRSGRFEPDGVKAQIDNTLYLLQLCRGSTRGSGGHSHGFLYELGVNIGMQDVYPYAPISTACSHASSGGSDHNAPSARFG